MRPPKHINIEGLFWALVICMALVIVHTIFNYL